MSAGRYEHELPAMILAAGRGERMKPLTDHTPKPLLKINGKALIDYHLERLAAAGIRRVLINVCWLAEQIQQHVGDGRAFGLQVSYSVEDQALETAGGIIKALPFLGDGEFLLLNADVYSANPLPQLCAQPLGENLARLLLTPRPDYLPGDFGLAQNRILRKEDPATGSLYTYCGLGRYTTAMFRDHAEGYLPLRPLLLAAIDSGRLGGEVLDGDWLDVGTPERLSEANRA